MPAPLLHVVGARPNFMKAAPVIDALSEAGVRQLVVHTGQHYDAQLSQVFFDELGLPEPDRYLGIGSGSHATQTAALLTALELEMSAIGPLRVVVYGDVNSTLAASLVAAKLGCPIAHVEAGLRSFDRSMPEEVNRVVTDALSDLLFVTSPEAIHHLAREGIRAESVYFVGNPMIDTLDRFRDRLNAERTTRKLGLPDRYGVVTLHRPSNVDDPVRGAKILKGLEGIAELMPLVFPIHPRGRRNLEALGLVDLPGIDVIEPLGYVDFISVVSRAAAVITDSGGIQEETTVLGVPCLTVRDNTERPITVSAGTNQLVPAEPAAMVSAVLDALDCQVEPVRPPLWDGRAGERIAEVLQGVQTL